MPNIIGSSEEVKSGSAEETAEITQYEIEEPTLYKVLLHNDDLTPMDFVVQVLIDYFNKSKQDAITLMLKIHNEGFGVCGIYAFELAETKVALVQQAAKQEGHPLKCSLEEV